MNINSINTFFNPFKIQKNNTIINIKQNKPESDQFIKTSKVSFQGELYKNTPFDREDKEVTLLLELDDIKGLDRKLSHNQSVLYDSLLRILKQDDRADIQNKIIDYIVSNTKFDEHIQARKTEKLESILIEKKIEVSDQLKKYIQEKKEFKKDYMYLLKFFEEIVPPSNEETKAVTDYLIKYPEKGCKILTQILKDNSVMFHMTKQRAGDFLELIPNKTLIMYEKELKEIKEKYKDDDINFALSRILSRISNNEQESKFLTEKTPKKITYQKLNTQKPNEVQVSFAIDKNIRISSRIRIIDLLEDKRDLNSLFDVYNGSTNKGIKLYTLHAISRFNCEQAKTFMEKTSKEETDPKLKERASALLPNFKFKTLKELDYSRLFRNSLPFKIKNYIIHEQDPFIRGDFIHKAKSNQEFFAKLCKIILDPEESSEVKSAAFDIVHEADKINYLIEYKNNSLTCK